MNVKKKLNECRVFFCFVFLFLSYYDLVGVNFSLKLVDILDTMEIWIPQTNFKCFCVLGEGTERWMKIAALFGAHWEEIGLQNMDITLSKLTLFLNSFLSFVMAYKKILSCMEKFLLIEITWFYYLNVFVFLLKRKNTNLIVVLNLTSFKILILGFLLW